MTADTATGSLVLFGGGGYNDPLADSWTWSGTNWIQLNPATSPSARDYPSLAYDALTASVILFGGNCGAPNCNLGDTWSWNGSNWTQLNPALSPTARFSAGMAADGINGAAVLFGGMVTFTSFLNDTWRYPTSVPSPTVTAISPTAGPAAGGTAVTITGTSFSTTSGQTSVSFGANAATNVNCSSTTTCMATSPAGIAGSTVDVTVTTPGGASATSGADQFTYFALPTVTGISPSNGPAAGNTTVTITGTNFSTTSGQTSVSFGANPATNVACSSTTTCTATSPAGSGTVDVTVTTPGGTSATSAADQFTYVALPVVTGINPTSGPAAGGTSLTITGSGFVTTPGQTAIAFGAISATSISCSSTTQCSATSPSGNGTVDVTVSTAGGTSATSSADQFTYVYPVGVSIQPPSAYVPLPGGGSTTVVVQAQAPPAKLGGWTIDVQYNPSVVQVTGCTGSNGSTCNTAFASNTVRVTGSSATGLSGSQPLASLSFQAAAGTMTGNSSALTPIIQSFTDPSNATISPTTATPGTITVGKLGDVNGDGVVTSVDALCVLRIVVGLPATTNCPIPPPGNPDINGDGQVTSVDALCILRGVVGLPATANCPAIAAPVSQPASSSAASAARTAPEQTTREPAGGGSTEITLSPQTLRTAPGERATLRVQARVLSGALGAWTIELHYEPSALQIAGCQAANGSLCNASFANGVVRISGASAAGLSGDQMLATLTVEASRASSVQVRVNTLTNAGGQAIVATTQGATISAGGGGARP